MWKSLPPLLSQMARLSSLNTKSSMAAVFQAGTCGKEVRTV
jgi:hypothetical protein